MILAVGPMRIAVYPIANSDSYFREYKAKLCLPTVIFYVYELPPSNTILMTGFYCILKQISQDILSGSNENSNLPDYELRFLL